MYLHVTVKQTTVTCWCHRDSINRVTVLTAISQNFRQKMQGENPSQQPSRPKSQSGLGKRAFYRRQNVLDSQQLLQGHFLGEHQKRIHKVKEVQKLTELKAEEKLREYVFSIIEKYEQEKEIIREKLNRKKGQKVELTEQKIKKKKQPQRQTVSQMIFKNRKKQQQFVYEQLGPIKKEKAASTAELEEWMHVKAVAATEAERLKWIKKDEDDKLERLKIVSHHRRIRVEELKMKREEERQRAVRLNKENKEVDRLFMEESLQKDHMARAERLRHDIINFSRAADRRACLEQARREKLTPALQNLEALRMKFQRPVLHEHPKAAEDRSRTCREVHRHKSTYALPPISKAYPKCSLRAKVDEYSFRDSDGGMVSILPL